MRRRGLRTGYVRALECIWGLVFQSIQGSEQTVAKLIANTSRKSFWTRDEPREGQKSGQPPIDTWKSSTIPGAIDALLSDVVDELDGNELDAGSFDTSELGIEAEISWHLSQQPHQSRADHRGVSSSPSNHPEEVVLPWTALPSQLTMDCSRTEVQTDTYCPGTDGSARTQVRQLPSNAQQLLNRYFAVTHSWFPILDRHAVYKTFFAYRNKFAVKRPEKWESAEDAVMWAIFAYASMLHVPQGVESTNVKQNVSSCLDDLYVTARQMLPLEREDGFTVGHVQVLLILSLFHYTSGECHLARMLTGQAVLVAGHIGLDELDKYPKDCHRRVWLGCFVLETLLAVSTGKPPRIQSHQIQAFLPIDNSGSEEWEPWQLQDLLLPGAGAETAELAAPRHSLTVFAQLVELLRVFNHWICDDAGRLDKNYNQLLKSWGDSLPEHITAIFNTNIASSAPSVSPPPNMLNLYMVYAVVNTKLSSSSDLASEFNGGHILRTLVNATEGVCRCFDQCSIPPSFAILRSLLPSKSAEQGTLGDAISELKRILRKTHIQQERTAYSLKIPLEGNLQVRKHVLTSSPCPLKSRKSNCLAPACYSRSPRIF